MQFLFFYFYFEFSDEPFVFICSQTKFDKISVVACFFGIKLFSYRFDFSNAHSWFEFLVLDFWISVIIQTFKQLNWSSILLLLDVIQKMLYKKVAFCHFWMLLVVLITSKNAIWSLFVNLFSSHLAFAFKILACKWFWSINFYQNFIFYLFFSHLSLIHFFYFQVVLSFWVLSEVISVFGVWVVEMWCELNFQSPSKSSDSVLKQLNWGFISFLKSFLSCGWKYTAYCFFEANILFTLILSLGLNIHMISYI